MSASGRHVDWRAVARDYDGIEISPYRSDRPAMTGRHACFANWDIASGGVWRPRGVRLTPTRPSTWRGDYLGGPEIHSR